MNLSNLFAPIQYAIQTLFRDYSKPKFWENKEIVRKYTVLINKIYYSAILNYLNPDKKKKQPMTEICFWTKIMPREVNFF